MPSEVDKITGKLGSCEKNSKCTTDYMDKNSTQQQPLWEVEVLEC